MKQLYAGVILVVTGYEIGPILLWFLPALLSFAHNELNIKMTHTAAQLKAGVILVVTA